MDKINGLMLLDDIAFHTRLNKKECLGTFDKCSHVDESSCTNCTWTFIYMLQGHGFSCLLIYFVCLYSGCLLDCMFVCLFVRWLPAWLYVVVYCVYVGCPMFIVCLCMLVVCLIVCSFVCMHCKTKICLKLFWS